MLCITANLILKWQRRAMSAGHDPVAAAVHVRFRAESDRCYRSATVTLVLTELAMKQFS
jgi:hypothetical protein